MPRRWLAPLTASLAATVACALSVAGCSSAAGAAGRASASPSAPASQQSGPQYYLALGDSLATGYQPNGTTGQGYANQLDAELRAGGRAATLEDLGCGGETTQTMVQGGTCSYPGASSQLQAAVAFLHAHQGQVPLITISIGGNDVNSCNGLASGADACVEAALPALNKNLNSVLSALRAADSSAVIAGVNYYVPELGSWLNGASGQALAAAQLPATKVMNAAMDSDYQAAGARTVDVFSAFKSEDQAVTTVAGHGRLPVDVVTVCDWTWECTDGDEHPNEAGYADIAKTVYQALPAG